MCEVCFISLQLSIPYWGLTRLGRNHDGRSGDMTHKIALLMIHSGKTPTMRENARS